MNPSSILFARTVVLALTVSTVAGCRNPSPPTVDPPPVVEAPSLTCPATVIADVQEAPAVVQYSAPVLTGGTEPVTTTCTIASGATFPVGNTDILCTATDAISRRAQCVFQVRVNVVAKLKGTKFLAFGDSITEGQVSPPFPGSQIRVVEPHNSYPTVLQGLLRDRYPSQAAEFVVFNKGIGGIKAVEDEQRFIDEVRSVRPDAVLLLHGTNDLNVSTSEEIAASIGRDIRRALREQVKVVFVSTLLPQVFGREKGGHPEAIIDANEEIRVSVAREGGILVDSYLVFNPQKEKLIGLDGLHPTAEGYKVLAETFLAAIKANFEAPPAAPASRRVR